MTRYLSELLRRLGLVTLASHMALSNELVEAKALASSWQRRAESKERDWSRLDAHAMDLRSKLHEAQAELRTMRYSVPGELHMRVKGAEAAASFFEEKWQEAEAKLHRPFLGITWEKAVEQNHAAFDTTTYHLRMRPYSFMVTGRDHFGGDEKAKRDAAWKHAWELAKGFEQDILQMLGVRP